jgi:beta-glucosidase/6-phospho-beta-glucosidase/beta-galactosidase
MWITVNEPMIQTILAFGACKHPPAKPDFFGDGCIFLHNQLLAHSLVYHLYKTEFKAAQSGEY